MPPPARAAAAAPQFKAMACPHCEALIALHPEHIERTHKCPKCAKTFLGKEAIKPQERKSNKKFEDLQLSGRQLGNYLLQEMLGHGACGAVYRGLDVMLKRTVAIKILPPSISSQDEISLQRFLQEAQLAAQLVHPNVVQIYYISHQDGIYYICMEYVDGGNLGDRIGRGRRVSPRRAMKYMGQSAEALRIAHSRGIIHRDIKPTNLMLTTDGAIKVADFGLAKLQDAQVRLTQERRVVGTPQYMSPEQCKGESATNKSDIYALGVTFYHALTGVPPYVAESLMGVAYKHIHDPIPDPRERVPELSEKIARVVMKCMAKSPGDRYSDAEALKNACEQAIADAEEENSTSSEAWATLSNKAAASLTADIPASAPGAGDSSSLADASHGRLSMTASMTQDSRKYLSHFGIDRFPFRGQDKPENFFAGGGYAKVLDVLQGHVEMRSPLVVLCGPSGSGKSYLTRLLLNRIQGRVEPYRMRAGFLWENSVLCTLGQEMNLGTSEDQSNSEKMLRELHRREMKRGPEDKLDLIVLDELKQIEGVMQDDLIKLCNLVGTTERMCLLMVGDDSLPDQLADRKVHPPEKPPVVVRLEALSLPQMQEYLAQRLLQAGVQPGMVHFTRAAMEAVHHYSKGLPGAANLICHNALILAGALNEARVTATMVLRAAQRDSFVFSAEELPILEDEQLGVFCRPDVIDVLRNYVGSAVPTEAMSA